jgi:hypothetical protein
LSFAYAVSVFQGPPIPFYPFVIQSKRCREKNPALIETLPASWIGVKNDRALGIDRRAREESMARSPGTGTICDRPLSNSRRSQNPPERSTIELNSRRRVSAMNMEKTLLSILLLFALMVVGAFLYYHHAGS